VTMKITFYWDRYSVVGGDAYQRLGGTYCVILQVFLRLGKYVPPKRR
jgi:hypothetical protein